MIEDVSSFAIGILVGIVVMAVILFLSSSGLFSQFGLNINLCSFFCK